MTWKEIEKKLFLKSFQRGDSDSTKIYVEKGREREGERVERERKRESREKERE